MTLIDENTNGILDNNDDNDDVNITVDVYVQYDDVVVDVDLENLTLAEEVDPWLHYLFMTMFFQYIIQSESLNERTHNHQLLLFN